MELNKICKVKSIKLSKKIIDNTEVKQIKQKINLKSYISKKTKNKDNQTIVIIETGSFIIQL